MGSTSLLAGEKEIITLFKKIEDELAEIQKERMNIHEIVQFQMEKFWSELPIQKQKALDKNQFIERYRDGLEEKIVIQLDEAEKVLMNRRAELSAMLSTV